jgi:hypothetical protein
VNIATRYSRLLARQNSIANRRFNYASLADLTERTLALYAAGRINFLQVQRSLQQQLQVESSLILAQQNYRAIWTSSKLSSVCRLEESAGNSCQSSSRSISRTSSG